MPAQPPPDEGLLRRDLPLPELAEPDVVRYFTHLSQANFSVDTNFYPLGSCTMKYNPKVNDELASIPGFAGLHPLQGPESTQGALELMHRLQDYLCQITGLPGCSLATLAGAHGELAGVLMTQAYHRSRGEDGRKVILIPRQRTRDQPRLGLDGRLRGGGGAVDGSGGAGHRSAEAGGHARPGGPDDHAAQARLASSTRPSPRSAASSTKPGGWSTATGPT